MILLNVIYVAICVAAVERNVQKSVFELRGFSGRQMSIKNDVGPLLNIQLIMSEKGAFIKLLDPERVFIEIIS